jgi:inner membrane protein
MPDADVVGLMLGIPYEHLWGHRGMTHSIAFAVMVGMAIPKLAVPNISFWSRRYGVLVIYFGLVTMSHGLLDAVTDGGLGVAFFAPFDPTRYFFSWRPITVSPIGLTQFFSPWGFGVLLSELVWIGIPVACWLIGLRWIQKAKGLPD